MNFYYFKAATVAAILSTGTCLHAQDLIAGRAPIDKRLKSVDSLALEKMLKVEQIVHLSADIYPDWNNKSVHYSSNQAIPDNYQIRLTGFSMPTTSTKVTSPFGPRRRRMHSGIDLKVYVGDSIVAAFDGKVRIVDTERRGYGKYVVIRHHNGLETVYGHLSKHLVTENQEVKAGELIGLGGNTGRSSGSHLHFETRFLGIAINPALLFNFEKQDILADTYVFNKQFTGGGTGGGTLYAGGDKAIRYHKVKSGDTLGALAVRYKVSVDTLCRLNRITAKTILRRGQVLRCS